MNIKIKKIMLDWNKDLSIDFSYFTDTLISENIEVEYKIPKEVLNNIWKEAEKNQLRDLIQKSDSNNGGCNHITTGELKIKLKQLKQLKQLK